MKTLSDPYKVRLFTYGTLKREGRLAQLVAAGKFWENIIHYMQYLIW